MRLQALAASPDIYEKLVQSVAPGIWQLDDIKKGLLCQLFGGTSKVCRAPLPQRVAKCISLEVCRAAGAWPDPLFSCS